jgi:membrane protease YdiL (CAAX protease family)
MFRLQLAALLALLCLALFGLTGRLRFLSEEFPDRLRRGVGALLLAAILTACVFYPTLTMDQGDSLELDEIWFPGLFSGHVLLVGFLLAWRRLRQDVSLSQLVLLSPLVREDVWRGVWLGAMGWTLTILTTALISPIAGHDGLTPGPEDVPSIMLWLAELPIWRKLAIIFVAMTVEEAFFRGFLQPRVGWITSSILFALGHASYGLPLMLVSVFVISLVLGWSLRQTGRLLPCIIAHGVFDAIQLLLIIPLAVKMLGSQ